MNDPYKFTENTTTLTTMAGEPELTGMAKHFNSMTFTGRANVAKVRILLLQYLSYVINLIIYLG